MRRVSAPASRVAIIGAGMSALVPDLLERGYQSIEVVDLSSTALERLRDRLGDRASMVRFQCADVRDVTFDEAIDVWHDRATMHFLTAPDDQQRYVRAAAAAVSPGGHVVLALFSEQAPERCSGLPVARHSPDSLSALFGEHFTTVETFTHDHLTPWGAPQSFIHALLRRNEPSV